MKIIPAINETDFEEIKKKINLIKDFGAEWAHIDVSDGKFTPNLLWNRPKDLADLRHTTNDQRLNIEVHLMIKNPDKALENWLEVGVRRAIVHIEAAKDIEVMKKQCEEAGAELALAVNPDTPIERLFESYEIGSHKIESHKIESFLILAVLPGLPGQKFQESQLDKIRVLRQKMPDATIIVDGGVNLETAPEIKRAGADILVSASYIWESGNPKEAYNKLQAV